MIITRTPFRISFVGGGSDFKEYYQEEPGAVISVSIDKYIFLSMHPLFNKNGYFLKYSTNEFVDSPDQIQHSIIREIFTQYKIKGVDFNSSSDVPAGTGLGSSSSFTVGLLNLCYTYKNKVRSKADLAREACSIEIDKLSAPIGKQDQYAVSFGGLNFIKFNSDETVQVKKIVMDTFIEADLEASLMLFYLGECRSAALTLTEQKQNVEKNRPTLRKMVKLAGTLYQELNNGQIDCMGATLHENWMYKKELASNISNPTVDLIYETAKKHGAAGGKLLGAGSTGFLLLSVPPEKQKKMQKVLGLYRLPFTFDYEGTTVIY